MRVTYRLKAPVDLINDTVTAGNGTVYYVPPNGIIYAARADVRDLMALGFWPYRDVDEQYDQGALNGGGGDGSVVDPGDLTVYFDNALL